MTSIIAQKQALQAQAIKDLPPVEFPADITLESMRCKSLTEWDDRIKRALLRSGNSDFWKPHFPGVRVENDDEDEIERYKIENAQLLEQAVAMFQSVQHADVDLIQDNLEQNILTSANLDKEIAELKKKIDLLEYVISTCKK